MGISKYLKWNELRNIMSKYEDLNDFKGKHLRIFFCLNVTFIKRFEEQKF